MIFIVENAFDRIFAKPDELCHTACAAGDDRLNFVHDIDIVQALCAGLCISDVFKIADRIFLPIQIIWAITGFYERFLCIFRHTARNI